MNLQTTAFKPQRLAQPKHNLDFFGIPHYLIDGRPYFLTAKDRDRAVALGLVNEPILPERMLMKRRDTSGRAKAQKYHWRGSDCVKSHYQGWSWETRDRVLDGAEFSTLTKEEMCATCLFEFENA